MEEAEGLCDELAILEKGRFVASGTLHDLLHDIDFSEIIQLKGIATRDDLSPLTSLPGVGHWERSEDVMRLYVSRAADYMEPLERILNADTSLELKITPISLENLFLHLTGRKAHAGGKTEE
jgi:ABC-2 type transport system ATP-binding protein